MFNDILSAIPFGVILSFTIGPVFFVLLETGATKGIRAALSFDFGVILADILFIAIAFFSTNKLLDKLKDDPNFLIFGGVLLITYGAISYIKISRSFRSIVKEYQNIDIPKKNYWLLFIKGFLLNFINIGVLIGWLGFIVIGSSLTTSQNGVLVFISTMLLTYFIVDIFKILAARRLRNKLTPKRVFKTKKVIAILILIFGIILLVQGLFPDLYEKSHNQLQNL